MIAVAAIDLMNGEAVQLVKGDPAAARVTRPDPVEVAAGWVRAGFRRLHLIDLDAALDQGENRALVRRIAEATGVPVQVGGGIRTRAAAEAWIESGVDRVIVGTRGISDPKWTETLAAALPARVVVAADVREGQVVTHGWRRGSGLRLAELLARLDGLPLAGVLVTDVDREGQEKGADRQRFATAVEGSRHPILAAGGVSSAADLAALAAAGVAEAVLGMALYTGKVTPDDIRDWLDEPLAEVRRPDRGEPR